jgi:hypothetical protein
MKLDAHLAGTGADVQVQCLGIGAYRISDFNTRSNPTCPVFALTHRGAVDVYLTFQHGDLAENGRNGITPQALLAVVADHLDASSDRRSEAAAYAVRDAIEILKARATERVTDGLDPIQAPCPCSARDKKCDAPMPTNGKEPKTPRAS